MSLYPFLMNDFFKVNLTMFVHFRQSQTKFDGYWNNPGLFDFKMNNHDLHVIWFGKLFLTIQKKTTDWCITINSLQRLKQWQIKWNMIAFFFFFWKYFHWVVGFYMIGYFLCILFGFKMQYSICDNWDDFGRNNIILKIILLHWRTNVYFLNIFFEGLSFKCWSKVDSNYFKRIPWFNKHDLVKKIIEMIYL